MDLSSHQGEIPIPITTSYGGGGGVHGHVHAHVIHHEPTSHNHIINIPSSTTPHHQLPSNGAIISPTTTIDDHMPFTKKLVKYRECRKNHAAAMGGNATDGCGEFMPSGEEGSLEALKCSACNCHRNFHRKEIEGEATSCDFYRPSHLNSKMARNNVIVGHHKVLGSEALGYPTGAIIPSRAVPPPPHHHQHHPLILPYNMSSLLSESDEQEGVGGDQGMLARAVKKRFRTKFSQDQKEKMLNFAEKVGWRMPKQEESAVQQFCQEIGVKRRVLKVWMHNNKLNLAKKLNNNSSSTP